MFPSSLWSRFNSEFHLGVPLLSRRRLRDVVQRRRPHHEARPEVEHASESRGLHVGGPTGDLLLGSHPEAEGDERDNDDGDGRGEALEDVVGVFDDDGDEETAEGLKFKVKIIFLNIK